jgi:LuxR family transcriptional regulator, maltose regulon positive regulatory protein
MSRQAVLTPVPKLHPQLGTHTQVARVGLLDLLEASSRIPVAAIVAPPGYGKTTLLAQWAERDPRAFGWLTLDRRDNDPAVLLRSLAAALDRLDPVDSDLLDAVDARGAAAVDQVLPRLGSALSRAEPAVVVLDDVHLLQDLDCLGAVARLIDYLPEGSQLAIASQGEPPLPLARLRAEGRVVEVGPGDLAMDTAEASSLLEHGKVDVGRVDLEELLRRTEGWPVALHFAAKSLGAGGRGAARAATPAPDDRFMAGYLEFELLSRLPPGLVSFLTRCSVLEGMSGPLCDAVLASTGSADLLESLSRSDLLVVPLDRRRRWYRFHRLFRELLRAELERREPTLAVELTRRRPSGARTTSFPSPPSPTRLPPVTPTGPPAWW